MDKRMTWLDVSTIEHPAKKMDLHLFGERHETVRVRPILDPRSHWSYHNQVVLKWSWTSKYREDLKIPAGRHGREFDHIEEAVAEADTYILAQLKAVFG